MNHTLVGNCAIYGSSTKGTSVSVNKVIYSCKKIAATWILYQITTPNKYLGCWYNGLVFCRNNGWIMENMDKELTLPKWVLIVRPKIASKKFSPKYLPKPKSLRFLKKSSVWVSVVGAHLHEIFYYMNSFVCFLKIGEHWKKDPLLSFFFSLVKNNFLVFTCFDKNALSKRIKNLTLSNTLFLAF